MHEANPGNNDIFCSLRYSHNDYKNVAMSLDNWRFQNNSLFAFVEGNKEKFLNIQISQYIYHGPLSQKLLESQKRIKIRKKEVLL